MQSEVIDLHKIIVLCTFEYTFKTRLFRQEHACTMVQRRRERSVLGGESFAVFFNNLSSFLS